MSEDRKPDMRRLRPSRSRTRSRSRSPRRRRDRDSPVRSSGGHSKMVYISNIPYDVRWMELKDLIREKAGDVAFVEMLDGPDGKPKGCAVVEFKDRDLATKCVDVMHRMAIKDRNLVVKEIRDPERFFRKVKEETGIDFLANRSGAPQSILNLNIGGSSIIGGGASQTSARVNYETYGLSPTFLKQLGIEGPLCSRVFAANLPYQVGPTKLKEVFSLAGTVADVDLQLDNTGKNKGLAVIEYTHPIEAVQAISMLHNQKFHDRSITVKMDKFDKPQELRRSGELPAGLKGIGIGLGSNGTALVNVAQLVGAGTGTNGNSIQSVGMGNVGYSSTAAALPNSSFNFGGGNVGSGGGGLYGGAGLTSLLSGPISGGSNLMGTHMSTSSNAWTGGNSVVSNYGASGLSSTLDGGAITGGYRGTTAAAPLLNSATSGSYDRVRDYDRSVSPTNIHSMRQQARSIIIRNLPLDYSWQTLRDRLRGFGEVEYADICSPGVGRVRFKTAMDAEKAALNLNGILVEGHPITVDLAMTE